MLERISRNEVHNAIDELMDYYRQLGMSANDMQCEAYYKSRGALEALQKLKHELDMEMKLSPYRLRQIKHQEENPDIELSGIIAVFKNSVPHRTPAKYAHSGNKWYIYSENKADNGNHLPTLIENGWYCIEDGRCYPVTPLEMPKNIAVHKIPRKSL